jgi:amino acid permease
MTESNNNTKGTLFSSILNLVNTIIGTGMLGLPGAFAGSGYFGGFFLLIVSAAFSAHGLMLLTKAADITGVPCSFYSLTQRTIPRCTILIDLSVALKCFGVATGYLITVADCMVDAMGGLLRVVDSPSEYSSSWSLGAVLVSRRFWVTSGICAVLPMSFYRTFDALKHAGVVALGIVLFLVTAVIAYAHAWLDPCEGHPEGTCQGEWETFTDIPRTFQQLPIFIFSFTCQQNIFPIVNEITNRTMKRLAIVNVTAIFIALLVYLIVATEGYNTYGSKLRGDLLLSYPKTHIVTTLRICVAALLVLHYPLQLDPARRCIVSIIGLIQKFPFFKRISVEAVDVNELELVKASSSLQSHDHLHSHSEVGDSFEYLIPKKMDAPTITVRRHSGDRSLFVGVTVLFLFSSLLIAFFVENLGSVLSVVGCTGSTLVTFILPGLISVKLHPGKVNAMAYFQFFLGCAIMPSTLYHVLSRSMTE